MPGNVSNYTPTAVFPQLKALSYTSQREYATRESTYPDGSSQRKVIPDGSPTTSRKRFRFTIPRNATDMATLKTFYEDRKGPLTPFYFYDPYETSPLFSYDPTGTETTGRRNVRFAGPLKEEWKFPRGTVEFELIEVT